MRRLIAVIGGRQADNELLTIAEDVGSRIVRKGAVLVCGGLTGVMEAASRGAKKEGGVTIGILPEGKEDANPYIDIPISTGLGLARNAIIANSADALIAIGGEYGTLSEIAFALQIEKPVIGIKTWDIKGVVPAESAEDAVAKIFKILS